MDVKVTSEDLRAQSSCGVLHVDGGGHQIPCPDEVRVEGLEDYIVVDRVDTHELGQLETMEVDWELALRWLVVVGACVAFWVAVFLVGWSFWVSRGG